MITARAWRLATGAYAALIFAVSVIPVNPSLAPGQLDKVAHLCEYLVLAWLLAQVFRLQNHPRKLWAAWGWATSYGAAIEGIQMFIPWRSGDISDLLANGLGAVLGIAAARWVSF